MTDEVPAPGVWRRCGSCPDYWCWIHGAHVHDCDCPDAFYWTVDPYSCSIADGLVFLSEWGLLQ